jgi:hypothetical protein
LEVVIGLCDDRSVATSASMLGVLGRAIRGKNTKRVIPQAKSLWDLAVGENPWRVKPQRRYQPEIWLGVWARSKPSRG